MYWCIINKNKEIAHGKEAMPPSSVGILHFKERDEY